MIALFFRGLSLVAVANLRLPIGTGIRIQGLTRPSIDETILPLTTMNDECKLSWDRHKLMCTTGLAEEVSEIGP